MNWLLSKKLDKLGNRVSPDPAFVRRLEREIRQMMPQSSVMSWIQWHRQMAWASGGVLAVSLAVSGTGVFAYQSDTVTPGHVLYPVRLVAEQVEAVTATTPEAKAKVQARHLRRRLHEQEILQKNKQLNPARTAEFEKGVDQAVESLKSLPPEQASRLQEEIGKMEKKHLQLMKRERDALPESEKANVEKEIEAKRAKIQSRVEQHQLRADVLDEIENPNEPEEDDATNTQALKQDLRDGRKQLRDERRTINAEKPQSTSPESNSENEHSD